MREWFKYEFGYVNIDDNNVYMTRTGNWSETKEMPEKNKKVAQKNNRRGSTVIVVLAAFTALILFGLFRNMMSNTVGIPILFLLVAGLFKLYQYTKRDIGGQFKIPFSKLNSIEIKDQQAVLHFTNGENEADTQTLSNIEEKGLQLLITLSKNQI